VHLEQAGAAADEVHLDLDQAAALGEVVERRPLPRRPVEVDARRAVEAVGAQVHPVHVGLVDELAERQPLGRRRRVPHRVVGEDEGVGLRRAPQARRQHPGGDAGQAGAQLRGGDAGGVAVDVGACGGGGGRGVGHALGVGRLHADPR